jgi:hypothetical protein
VDRKLRHRLAQWVERGDCARDIPRLLLYTEAVLSVYRQWFPFRYDATTPHIYVNRAVAELLSGAADHDDQKSPFALLCVAIQELVEKDAEEGELAGRWQIRRRFPA